MLTYEARWPITDQSRTFSQLVTEASEDLPGMVDAASAVIVGDPTWRIEPGDEPHLVATVEVTTIPADMRSNRVLKHDRHTVIAQHPGAAHAIEKGEAIREKILDLLDEHPNLSTWEIAHVLRLSTRTVQRHVKTITQGVAA